MTTEKYAVTFKFVKTGTVYTRKDKTQVSSRAGHTWFVLHKTGAKDLDYGFASEEELNPKTKEYELVTDSNGNALGTIKEDDSERYDNSDLTSITIQLNQTQYQTLKAFGEGKRTDAFDYKKYDPIDNSCVSFIFKALNLIGYNPENVIPKVAPIYDSKKPIVVDSTITNIMVNGYHHFFKSGVYNLIDLLAKNGAIEVKGNNTLIPVSESRSNDIITRPYEIKGYDDTHDAIIGGKGNDRLIGGSGDDILIGGNGTYSLDDDYYGSITVRDDGDDILEGGEGYDIYYIGGKDTIIDSDGKGEIRFLDKDYKMRQQPKEFLKKVFEDGTPWPGYTTDLLITDDNPSTGFAVFETTGLRLEATGFEFRSDLYDSHCLSRDKPAYVARSITLTHVKTGHQVTIKNFRNLDLGIRLLVSGGDRDLREEFQESSGSWLKANKELIDSSRSYDLRKDPSEDKDFEGEGTLDENHPASPYYGKGYEIEQDQNYCPLPPIITKVRGGPITSIPSKPEKEKNDNKVSPDKGDNSRVGTENDDIMHGSNKNADTIFDAGDGNDKIYAGDGDDTLIGGKGNDLLQGGNGKDIYVLEKGHGQDIISEFNTGKDDDTLQFNGINFNDVKFRRDNYDFILFGYNEQDSVTIKAFFANPNNQLEHFQFADRSLSLAQMQTEGITLSGTEKDDIMHDWDKTANTTFNAGDGNDKIYAGDGDDTLIGGKGNDLLQGGNGKDTYVFEKGHGQDIITEFNTDQDDDTLQFNDINFNEVKFRRDNYDLTLFGYNEQDSVTIKAFFANKNNQLERYQFADRTLSREALTEEMMLVNNQVDRMVQAISGFGARGASGVLSSTQDDVKNQWQLAPSV